jgi:DNA-directed RNA polymerase specialized sigma24 family protein
VLIPQAIRNVLPLLHASGLDFEDAHHHLTIIFAKRLQGDHPYDADRGAQLRTYLFMLARSVLINLTKKAKRRSKGLGRIEEDQRERVADLTTLIEREGPEIIPDMFPSAV